jgi:hypothetical protein
MTGRTLRVLAAMACLFASEKVEAAAVSSFDDIVYWIGAGSKRAALVIDFNGDAATDLSLVWGFRWNGDVFARAMLDAVVAADDRLFAKISNELTLLDAVLGVGYDRNDDGQFQTIPVTDFDDDGVAYGSPIDNAAPGAGDWYREGWWDGFWHFGHAHANPWTTGAWTSSNGGAHVEPLDDGEWNSWAFTADEMFPNFRTKFAQNPVAATPPGGYADFDGNHDVDGADFLSWQVGFGTSVVATPAQGDANSDGDVDVGDLTTWCASFGAPPVAHFVPEPAAAWLAASCLFGFVLPFTHLRND